MALTDSLISYYKLDEASGDAADAHGSNTLTDTNTVASATGKINNARDFESANTEYFTHADNTDLSTGDIDFTFAAWLNLESNNVNRVFIAKDSGSNGEFQAYYRPSTNRFTFDVYGASAFGSLGRVAADALGAPSLATWYFVVMWHDAAANTINIQVNDGTVNSTSHSAGVFDGTGNFRIGNNFQDDLWDGLVDEVGFWKRTLTSGERTSLYNGGAGFAYPFGGAAATGYLNLPLLGVG